MGHFKYFTVTNTMQGKLTQWLQGSWETGNTHTFFATQHKKKILTKWLYMKILLKCNNIVKEVIKETPFVNLSHLSLLFFFNFMVYWICKWPNCHIMQNGECSTRTLWQDIIEHYCQQTHQSFCCLWFSLLIWWLEKVNWQI